MIFKPITVTIIKKDKSKKILYPTLSQITVSDNKTSPIPPPDLRPFFFKKKKKKKKTKI